MKVTVETERWEDAQPGIAALCPRHWEEIALNKATIPLEPDWGRYQQLADLQMLETTTARNEAGDIVGYLIYIVAPHLHYKSSTTAMSDVLFLAPEYRRGTLGLKLLSRAEDRLCERGVQRVIQNVKLHNDWGAILERMGYAPIERIYSKMLGH